MLITKEVEVSLSSVNTLYYESLGYIIPRYYNKNKNKMVVRRGTKILVKFEDLMKCSTAKIQCLCDYCLEEGIETIVVKKYNDYIKKLSSIVKKDCCKNCRSKKQVESVLLKYNVTCTTQIKEVAQKISNKNKTSYDIVAKEFSERNYIIVTTREKYYSTINKRNTIEYICLKHPEKGVLSISWDAFYNGKNGCFYCGLINSAEKRKHKISNIKKLFENEGYTLLTSVYKDNSQKLQYICSKHGIKYISLNHFLSGKRCNQCQRERISDSQRHSDYDVEMIIKNYDSSIEIVHIDYKTYNDNSIAIKCKECSSVFNTRLPFILYGKVRCDRCTNAQSESEFITETYLLNSNINYDKEVSFEGCSYINKLTFDFVIYDDYDNIMQVIELDGQQHYKPVCFGGMSEEDAQVEYEKNLQRDEIKNEYCKENNIQLLRIPYWDFDKIEKILEYELSKLCKSTRVICTNNNTVCNI